MATVAERVQRGIELLDANGPKEWRQKVKVLELDISSLCNCVLGQVFGCFGMGRGELGYDGTSLDYGFDFGSYEDRTALQDEWTRRLTEP